MNQRNIGYRQAPPDLNYFNQIHTPYSSNNLNSQQQIFQPPLQLPSVEPKDLIRNTFYNVDQRNPFPQPIQPNQNQQVFNTPYSSINHSNQPSSPQPRFPSKPFTTANTQHFQNQREDHDRQREQIYKQLPVEQKILSEKKQNQRCETCQQFSKMTHVFHSIIPKPEDFWRILIDNDDLITENEKPVQFILRTNISVTSFIISDDKTKKIKVKNKREIAILKKVCDPYAINIIEIKNDIAFIEKTIFVKKIIQMNIRTIREILEESMKMTEIKSRQSVIIIDDADIIQENSKGKINPKDIASSVLELFGELSIDSFNAFLNNIDEIEDKICRKYGVDSFNQLGEGEFTSFCGKNVMFPFSQTGNKRVVPIKCLSREVPIEDQPLSIIVEEINNSPYLTNLYENSIIKNVDLELVLSSVDFDQNVFIEINRNNIVKLPIIPQNEIVPMTEKFIFNNNVISALFIGQLFDENGPDEGASKFFPILKKTFESNGISMNTKVSRALFVANILNQMPVEFVGLFSLVKTILKVFDLTLSEIMTLSQCNICFLNELIYQEIKRCFANELLITSKIDVQSTSHKMCLTIEHEGKRFDFPPPTEIIIDSYKNQNGEEINIIDFQNPQLFTNIENALQKKDIEYLQTLLLYMIENQKEIIQTFHQLQVTSADIVQSRNYSSFYNVLKTIRWIPSTINTFETPQTIINSQRINLLKVPCTPFAIPEPLSSYIATSPFPKPSSILKQLHQHVKSYDQNYIDFLSVISHLQIDQFNEFIQQPIIFTRITNNVVQTYIKKDESWFEPKGVFIRDGSGFYPIISSSKSNREIFESVGVKHNPSVIDYVNALIEVNKLQDQISFNKKITVCKNLIIHLIKQSTNINVSLPMIETLKKLEVFVNQNNRFVSLTNNLYYDDLIGIKEFFPSNVKDYLLDLELPNELKGNKIFYLLNIKNAQSAIKVTINKQVQPSGNLTNVLRKSLLNVIPLVKTSTPIGNYQLFLSSIQVFSHGNLSPTFTFIPTGSTINPRVSAVRDGVMLHVLERTSICSYEALCVLSQLFFLQIDESFISLMLKELSGATPIQIETTTIMETETIKTNTIDWNVIKDGIKQNKNVIGDEEIEIKVQPYQFIPNIEKRIQTGVAGEQFIYQYLKRKYGDKVDWINEKTATVETIEKGLPYDLIILNEFKTVETYIEVKTTQYNDKNFFELSYREWSFAQEQRSHFHIYRLSGFGTDTLKIKVIVDPYGKWLKGEVQIKFYF